jgi:hypothetical protein
LCILLVQGLVLACVKVIATQRLPAAMPAWVPRWMTASAAETGSSGVQEQQQQQQAELGGASSTSSRGDPPRKRAAGPRFDTLPEFRAVHAQPAEPALPDDPTQRVEALKDSRFGPLFVRYSEC